MKKTQSLFLLSVSMILAACGAGKGESSIKPASSNTESSSQALVSSEEAPISSSETSSASSNALVSSNNPVSSSETPISSSDPISSSSAPNSSSSSSSIDTRTDYEKSMDAINTGFKEAKEAYDKSKAVDKSFTEVFADNISYTTHDETVYEGEEENSVYIDSGNTNNSNILSYNAADNTAYRSYEYEDSDFSDASTDWVGIDGENYYYYTDALDYYFQVDKDFASHEIAGHRNAAMIFESSLGLLIDRVLYSDGSLKDMYLNITKYYPNNYEEEQLGKASYEKNISATLTKNGAISTLKGKIESKILYSAPELPEEMEGAYLTDASGSSTTDFTIKYSDEGVLLYEVKTAMEYKESEVADAYKYNYTTTLSRDYAIETKFAYEPFIAPEIPDSVEDEPPSGGVVLISPDGADFNYLHAPVGDTISVSKYDVLDEELIEAGVDVEFYYDQDFKNKADPDNLISKTYEYNLYFKYVVPEDKALVLYNNYGTWYGFSAPDMYDYSISCVDYYLLDDKTTFSVPDGTYYDVTSYLGYVFLEATLSAERIYLTYSSDNDATINDDLTLNVKAGNVYLLDVYSSPVNLV